MDVNKLEASVKQDLSWLQKHEKLILGILIILAIVFAFNKYIDHSAKVADENAAVSVQVLKEQQEVNKKLLDRMDVQDQRYESLVQEMNRRNVMLDNAIAYRNTNLNKQQSVNNTLPLSGLVVRWKTLLNIPESDITIQGSNGMVTEAAARQTVNALEEIPVLKANLTDTETKLKNEQTKIAECNQVVASKDEVIEGQKKEIAATKDNADKQVAKVKADARKSKRSWFVRGVVVGAAVAAYIIPHII